MPKPKGKLSKLFPGPTFLPHKKDKIAGLWLKIPQFQDYRFLDNNVTSLRRFAVTMNCGGAEKNVTKCQIAELAF
jgi:hypothetical protein